MALTAPSRRLRIVRLVGIGVGLAVVGWLVRTLGPAHIAEHLRLVGGGFGLLLAAYLLATWMYSLPLAMVLPAPARPTSLGLLASRIAAVAVNAATPFLGLGGEPVRLLWLPAAFQHDGAAGLFVDRGAFIAASALFLGGGVVVAALVLPLPRLVLIVLGGMAAAGLLFAVALYLLQRRGGLAAPLARAAGLLFRRGRERLAAGARDVDARVRDLHTVHPGRFTAAVFLHTLGRCAAGLEVYAGARLLGMPIDAAGALVLTAAPLALDFAFSMVPSQIGLHEGLNAVMAQALGFDPAAGLALAFLQRLRQVVFVGAGFALLAARRQRPRADCETPAGPGVPA